jgi:membrane protein DedA with SNARE-associated domain/rhodanese-related sulfurtransferase
MNYSHTTYSILFVAVLGRQLCLPIPAPLFLLSAGALAAAGQLSPGGILALAVLGCLIADLVWFEAGRLRGRRALRLLCALAPDPSHCIRHSGRIFSKWGLPILLIAKFVPGLDGVTPPLAGMSRTPRATFLTWDAGGSLLWSGAYVGAGFVFARELDKVVRYASAFASLLLLVLGVPLLVFFLWRLVQLMRIARKLRLLVITPQQLKTRLDSGEKIGVLDLLRFEDDPRGASVIPGAVRVDPLEMRRTKRLVAPKDLDIVLYCASKNRFVSARVAAVLRKQGHQRIRVLEGGLDAWKALGFPLSATPVDPVLEIARLGIEVFPSFSPARAERAMELKNP